MRNELKFKFICTECHEPLEIPLGKNKRGASCHWAGDAEYVVNVEPCSKCIDKKTKHAREITQGIKGLLESMKL